jgi:hypothetical protein
MGTAEALSHPYITHYCRTQWQPFSQPLAQQSIDRIVSR